MKRWQCTVCKYIHTGNMPPEKCPVCGVNSSRFVLLEEQKTSPGSLDQTVPDTLYEKIKHRMIQHHAHPVLVHTPNGMIPAAVMLFILGRLFDSPLLVTAGFIDLVFVILTLPLVLFSGIIEWKKKYQRAWTQVFKLKILAASLTTSACVVSVVWYLADPGVVFSPGGWVFILVNILMLLAAGIAGHMGGKLVFTEK